MMSVYFESSEDRYFCKSPRKHPDDCELQPKLGLEQCNTNEIVFSYARAVRSVVPGLTNVYVTISFICSRHIGD